MFATVSYHLPNLAFHTDACSPLIFAGFIHRKWLQITSTLGILDSKCESTLSCWTLLKDHHESSRGTTQCLRELVVSTALCSVFSKKNWKRLIQSQHLWQKAPKEPRGYFDPRPQQNLRRKTQKPCKKKSWKLCWASLATSSVSTSTLVKAKKHLPFACGAGNFIKSWLELLKFLQDRSLSRWKQYVQNLVGLPKIRLKIPNGGVFVLSSISCSCQLHLFDKSSASC